MVLALIYHGGLVHEGGLLELVREKAFGASVEDQVPDRQQNYLDNGYHYEPKKPVTLICEYSELVSAIIACL